jgi:hypothetical protein
MGFCLNKLLQYAWESFAETEKKQKDCGKLLQSTEFSMPEPDRVETQEQGTAMGDWEGTSPNQGCSSQQTA